ncbi:MAG: OmpA family protein, partial [Alphaproteobacteria bacterium]|nr:OmpA family protein [Alphaproteobacteria bacterium]
MMRGFRATKKDFLRLAAVLAFAVNASACSSLPSVPDWVDPTTWLGDDSSATASDSNGQTPDLANLPEKPTAGSSADQQQQVADSLAADRGNTKYSADALRGGTEPAAAPPPDVAPAQVAATETMPVAQEKTASTENTTIAPAPTAQADRSVAPAPSGSAMPGTLPAVPGAAPVVAAASEAPESQVASVTPAAQAPVAPPPGAQPAVPPEPAVPQQQVASIAPSDAALGFKPSTAPPLDPSISQFVAPTIIQRYQQTAEDAGLSSAAPVMTASAAPARRAKLRRPAVAGEGMGGPENMTGAVVANLNAIEPAASTPSVYASPQGLPAAAVIFFPGDSVYLSAEGRAEVRAAVDQFKAHGGQGFIRVVGHSSSRTPNMPMARHLEVIFRKSQERATAVAREIIREGIPAGKVLVDAVGDSQPVYYESMPKGEDGNRRA